MGKPTGFMEWQREHPHARGVSERVRDFREFHPLHEDASAKKQAGRCMECGVPFCHQGCPLGNLIPDFNDLVFQGRWEEAYRVLTSTNNFPEFTGRLCPAPCEAACVLGIDQAPVTIESIEKQIAERAFAENWVKPRPPARRTGKRVAVVGSGPAGLAAAAQLNQAGHRVTVFGRAPKAGGLLRYGIPDFKMEKSVIDRRLELLTAEGVELRTGVDVGEAPTFVELRAEFDAVLLATGARRPRELSVPGRELVGVVQAMDFLEAQNRVVEQGAGESPFHAQGKRVLILGGGDTGSDCLGTAIRHGAREVTQVELLASPPASRADDNPWPQWPLVFRTSSSQEEGGAREFSLLTTRLEGEHGKLKALHARVLNPAPGDAKERVFPVDLVLLALGFLGPETGALQEQLGVAVDARGCVQVDRRYATNVPGVFCAGDAGRGASLIVWALAEGREAARHLDAYLRAAAPQLPTRGTHLHFGGR